MGSKMSASRVGAGDRPGHVGWAWRWAGGSEGVGRGEGAWAREGEAAEVGMGTTPAREGHGVGRGVGRCEGAG